MKSAYFMASASALVLATAFYATHAQPAPPPQGDAARCTALTGSKFAPDTVIENATWMPDGGTVGGTRVSVPFCRAVGIATPAADSPIGFEVGMPPASSWNGNFRGEGSGGSAGAISPGPMREALLSGYATMSTDNGHVDGADGGHGLSWAYRHPEKMVDW